MMSAEAKHILQVIDKQTLEVVQGDQAPEPGKTLAHVEFTRDGRHALASLWEDDGAVIVYRHADTLEEVKRLPMRSRWASTTCGTRSRVRRVLATSF
jgi:hypothetical protein